MARPIKPGANGRSLPLALPASTVRLHWHRRAHDDAGNRWLREVIIARLANA